MFCVFLRTEGSVRTNVFVVLEFLAFIVVSKGPVSKSDKNIHTCLKRHFVAKQSGNCPSFGKKQTIKRQPGGYIPGECILSS